MALTWTLSDRHKRVVVHKIFLLGCPDHSVFQTKNQVILPLYHIHSLFLQQCSLSWQNIPPCRPYIPNILTNHPTHAPLRNYNLQLNVQWDTELAWPQGQWFPHNLITLTSSPSCNELWYGPGHVGQTATFLLQLFQGHHIQQHSNTRNMWFQFIVFKAMQ